MMLNKVLNLNAEVPKTYNNENNDVSKDCLALPTSKRLSLCKLSVTPNVVNIALFAKCTYMTYRARLVPEFPPSKTITKLVEAHFDYVTAELMTPEILKCFRELPFLGLFSPQTQLPCIHQFSIYI